MPFYRFQAVDPDKSCEHCIECFEELLEIGKTKRKCPKCKNKVLRLVSAPNIIDGNRQPNQYPEVKGAKYWRDQNGNRHLVTDKDGDRRSSTYIPKKTRSEAEIKAMKQRDAQISKQKRIQAQARARVARIESMKRKKK